MALESKIIWTKPVRAHIRQPDIMVRQGEWRHWDTENEYINDVRRIMAYYRNNELFAAVLQRPDYDPCGRTNWIIDDEWSAE